MTFPETVREGLELSRFQPDRSAIVKPIRSLWAQARYELSLAEQLGECVILPLLGIVLICLAPFIAAVLP